MLQKINKRLIYELKVKSNITWTRNIH